MVEFIDKTTTVAGTKINRAALMGVQGFIANTVTFNSDGSITETNSEGHTLKTEFSNTGIKQTFTGTKTIVKNTVFNSDGSITETIQ